MNSHTQRRFKSDSEFLAIDWGYNEGKPFLKLEVNPNYQRTTQSIFEYGALIDNCVTIQGKFAIISDAKQFLKIYADQIDYTLERDLKNFIEELKSIKKQKRQKRPCRFIKMQDISTRGNQPAAVESFHATVRIKFNNRWYFYKKDAERIEAFRGRKVHEIEPFGAALARLMRPNTPKYYTVYNEYLEKRCGVMSEEIPNFKNFVEYYKTLPAIVKIKDIQTQLINAGIVPAIITNFILQNNDFHCENFGFDACDQIVIYDFDRIFWGLTSTYFDWGPYFQGECEKGEKIKVMAKDVLTVDKENLDKFPHCVTPQRWVTENGQPSAQFMEGIELNPAFIEQKWKYMLKAILIGDGLVDKVASSFFSSTKARAKYRNHFIKILNDLRKALLNHPDFRNYLSTHPKVIDELVQEFEAYNTTEEPALQVDITEIRSEFSLIKKSAYLITREPVIEIMNIIKDFKRTDKTKLAAQDEIRQAIKRISSNNESVNELKSFLEINRFIAKNKALEVQLLELLDTIDKNKQQAKAHALQIKKLFVDANDPNVKINVAILKNKVAKLVFAAKKNDVLENLIHHLEKDGILLNALSIQNEESSLSTPVKDQPEAVILMLQQRIDQSHFQKKSAKRIAWEILTISKNQSHDFEEKLNLIKGLLPNSEAHANYVNQIIFSLQLIAKESCDEVLRKVINLPCLKRDANSIANKIADVIENLKTNDSSEFEFETMLHSLKQKDHFEQHFMVGNLFAVLVERNILSDDDKRLSFNDILTNLNGIVDDIQQKTSLANDMAEKLKLLFEKYKQGKALKSIAISIKELIDKMTDNDIVLRVITRQLGITSKMNLNDVKAAIFTHQNSIDTALKSAAMDEVSFIKEAIVGYQNNNEHTEEFKNKLIERIKQPQCHNDHLLDAYNAFFKPILFKDVRKAQEELAKKVDTIYGKKSVVTKAANDITTYLNEIQDLKIDVTIIKKKVEAILMGLKDSPQTWDIFCSSLNREEIAAQKKDQISLQLNKLIDKLVTHEELKIKNRLSKDAGNAIKGKIGNYLSKRYKDRGNEHLSAFKLALTEGFSKHLSNEKMPDRDALLHSLDSMEMINLALEELSQDNNIQYQKFIINTSSTEMLFQLFESLTKIPPAQFTKKDFDDFWLHFPHATGMNSPLKDFFDTLVTKLLDMKSRVNIKNNPPKYGKNYFFGRQSQLNKTIQDVSKIVLEDGKGNILH